MTFRVIQDITWHTRYGVKRISTGTIVTILAKQDNRLLLDHEIGWVSNNSSIWNKLSLV